MVANQAPFNLISTLSINASACVCGYQKCGAAASWGAISSARVKLMYGKISNCSVFPDAVSRGGSTSNLWGVKIAAYVLHHAKDIDHFDSTPSHPCM